MSEPSDTPSGTEPGATLSTDAIAAAAFTEAVSSDWTKELRRTPEGRVQASLDNAVLILCKDPQWKGVLAYDEFSGRTMKLAPPPFATRSIGEWEDFDDSELRLWIRQVYGFQRISRDDLFDAVQLTAYRNRYHHVRDYLKHAGEVWDSRPRVKFWLEAYMGAAMDSPYIQRAGEIWLVSAVARIFRPGCKADHVLILEGPQGLGKSTALATLGGEWFTDAPFRLDNAVEAGQIIRGQWIIELSELDGFNRAESSAAKRFFSQYEDRYRSPWGRRPANVPRQCIFSGTVNMDVYLRDETGNRRYFPVRCTRADVDELGVDREQLWGEAVHLFHDGTPWWPRSEERSLFESEQEDRYVGDAWEAQVISYLRANPDVIRIGINEVFDRALKLDPSKWTKAEQTRVGQIMQRIGWLKRRELVGGLRERFYERPERWGTA